MYICTVEDRIGNGYLTICAAGGRAAGGPDDDIASYFFPRNRVYIHLYLTPVQAAQAAPHPVRRPQNAAAHNARPRPVQNCIRRRCNQH